MARSIGTVQPLFQSLKSGLQSTRLNSLRRLISIISLVLKNTNFRLTLDNGCVNILAASADRGAKP